MLALSLQIMDFFFAFQYGLHFFLIAEHDAQGKRNCYMQAFSNVIVRCVLGWKYSVPQLS